MVEFQHVKPGKGPAFVRTTLKHVLSGKVVDKTFNAGTKADTRHGRQAFVPDSSPRRRRLRLHRPLYVRSDPHLG